MGKAVENKNHLICEPLKLFFKIRKAVDPKMLKIYPALYYIRGEHVVERIGIEQIVLYLLSTQ